jgi:hypothetical protein
MDSSEGQDCHIDTPFHESDKSTTRHVSVDRAGAVVQTGRAGSVSDGGA